jgi:hypothetical protein
MIDQNVGSRNVLHKCETLWVAQEKKRADAVGNVMFVQKAQTLLKSMRYKERNQGFQWPWYLEPVAHIVDDFADSRKPRVKGSLTPSTMWWMSKGLIHETRSYCTWA